MAKKEKKVESIALDEQLSKSEAFIEKNLKTILIVIAAIIVVVAGFFIYRNHQAKVELEAQNAIAKSQQAFAQEQFEQALNGDGANVMGFLKIIDEYSGTKTANLAKLYAAICYANTDKTAEAIKMFEDFDAQNDQMVSPAALAALGNCYVKNGDGQKGAETLVKAAQKADNDAISPLALRQAGEVYESLNQTDKALELYQQIKDKYYRSPLANDIDKYIERVSK
ncbi:MAG: tetratricopeptide repeat protein [Bacteroidaceae bacterium]|nr:tetratricopeptide repeat protein [Bacteroidaceae bacterium]